MAVYRNVHLSFWTDNKVEDDFTPEDKYFYMYLLTNPQTNICGCYEVSYSQMTRQTGYNKDTVMRLLERFENVHKIIRFDKNTKEILILNWYKYNWNKSEKTLTGVENVAKYVKSAEFKKYIFDVIKSIKNDTPIMGHTCPIQASVSDTDINNIYINNKRDIVNISKSNNINNNILDELITEFNISNYLLDGINTWLKYKKERRFTYKESGLRTLVKTIKIKADEYGEQAVIAIIDESIGNGYQGITWDRIKKVQPPKSRQSASDQFDRLMEQIRRDEDDKNI
jgi:hypothetical protein